MTKNTLVGVSPETLQATSDWSHRRLAGAQLVPVPGGGRGRLGEVTTLWRRRDDRTAWAKAAIDALPSLVWLHSDTVGVDRYPLELMRDRGITLTNARGITAPAIAEWVTCTMLMTAKCIPELFEAARDQVWAGNLVPAVLAGQHALVLGNGRVGQAIGAACSHVGVEATCFGASSCTKFTPGSLSTDKLTSGRGWRAEVGRSDFLILALPLTDLTRGLVTREVLAGLPRGASVINVARAEILDQTPLLALLGSGHLGSAWLDVFHTEPLPADDPLWSEPKVHITPHLSGKTESEELQMRELFVAQLARFRAQQVLANRVDFERGY